MLPPRLSRQRIPAETIHIVNPDRQQFAARAMAARSVSSLALLALFAASCDDADTSNPDPSPAHFVASSDAELEKQIHTVCSHCHKYPEPDTFPKSVWPRELDQAFGFIKKSDLKPADVPSFDAVLGYYQERAPELFERPTPAKLTKSKRFQSHPVKSSRDFAGTAFVRWLQPKDEKPFGIAADMRSGHIIQWQWNDGKVEGKPLATVGNPVHTTVTDLDKDGVRDYLVSDIGDVLPSNATSGRLIWLHPDENGKLVETVLLQDVGRLVEAQPADFDGDGDLDLVVAVFGWRENGELLYLSNETADWTQPKFKSTQLDKRTGVINVPVADLNNDGHQDFVALFSQEHEEIIAFLGNGRGEFQQELLYTPNNPSYGSCAMRLTDMDGDGDLDVLYSNGDTLDLMVYKPYHAIQWLENTGEFPFKHHHLANFCGAFQAIEADLDGDGDLDIAAASFLPSGIYFDENGLGDPPMAFVRDSQMPSVIWLEQASKGNFRQHNLELVNCCHPSLAVGDFDGDGDNDIATANCSFEKFPNYQMAAQFNKLDAMTIWENVEDTQETVTESEKSSNDK
ncbi:MAG: hypothetical protein CMJ78_08980 [Planctomycetaceae bacterium]|nr:hypothetical protein [Planctomycetaceae bacterium]